MRRVDWRGLSSFNGLSERQAITQLFECCSSPMWALRVAKARAFSDIEVLLEYAADLILAELTENDLDDALAGHPAPGTAPTIRPHSANRPV